MVGKASSVTTCSGIRRLCLWEELCNEYSTSLARGKKPLLWFRNSNHAAEEWFSAQEEVKRALGTSTASCSSSEQVIRISYQVTLCDLAKENSCSSFWSMIVSQFYIFRKSLSHAIVSCILLLHVLLLALYECESRIEICQGIYAHVIMCRKILFASWLP